LPVLKEFVAKLTLSEMLEMFLEDKDMPYGRYFDYIEYMWSLRDEPNILLVFFEDLINVSDDLLLIITNTMSYM